jgi:AraC-like DNA-binding protein
MAKTAPSSRIVLATSERSPLGQVSMAAHLHSFRGTQFKSMRVFGSYAVVLLLKGAGRYIDALGTDRRVQAGDCIIVLPDVAHAYGPVGDDPEWDEFYIVFSGPVFDLWRAQHLLDDRRLVHRLPQPTSYWLTRLEQCASPDPLTAVTYVQRFLAELMTVSRRLQQTDADWLARATALIGVGEKPDWESIASSLDCGYETFRKRFTALSGQSPGKFHARRVIEHACDLLGDPNKSMREIAGACGFCDEFHFSRRFRQMMGVRPGALRERLLRSGESA